MPRHRFAVLATALYLGAVLGACSEAPAPAPEKKGREETRGVRGSEAIGYSGEAIADRVDATLDANEERERRLQQAQQDAGLAPSD